MKKTRLALAVPLLIALASAQIVSTEKKPTAVWNVYVRQSNMILTTSPNKTAPPQDPIAALTPSTSIVVRRIEAITMSGPKSAAGQGLQEVEPKPCPLQFTILITDGKVSQSIPISNTFLSKGSTQTYTDSGPLNVPFSSGSRVTVAVVPPEQGFPPVACGFTDLSITIQYEEEAPSKNEQ